MTAIPTGHSGQSNPQPKLKPCPFCGSENVRDNYDSGYFWVECVDCGCDGPRSFENYEWAIEKWNRRVGE